MIGRTAGAARRPRRRGGAHRAGGSPPARAATTAARDGPAAVRRRRPRRRLRGPPGPSGSRCRPTGPWTLAASVELHTGHRVLTDRGAVREFAASLREGLRAHVAEIAERTGARVLVQLDEPSLPAVLAGTLPTASGWGTVRSVPAPDAQDLLRDLVAGLGRAGRPALLRRRTRRCGCWPRPARPASGSTPRCPRSPATPPSPPRWTRWARSGTRGPRCCSAWSRRVPPRRATAGRAGRGARRPGPALKALARRAFDLADRLGFDRARLARPGRPHPDLRPRRRDPRVGAPGHGAVPRPRPGVRGPAGGLVSAAARWTWRPSPAG